MKMKKKLFIPLIAALLTIGLTSVGFATWVITGGDNKDVDGQNFTVHGVDDDRYSFTATSSSTINWGKSNKTQNNAWLTADHAAENLTAEIVLTPADTVDFESGEKTVKYVITPGVSDTGKWATAKSTGFVAEVPGTITLYVWYGTDGLVDKVTTDAAGNTAAQATVCTFETTKNTVTVKVTFKWGDLTSNQNPFDFFNENAAKANTPWTHATYGSAYTTYGDAAKAMLEGIAGLSGVKYTANVTGEIPQ